MDANTQRWAGGAAVILIAALVSFTSFRAPLQEPQEARYAEIPRQMLVEGSVLVPVLHGQAYCDKPPLFYWLVLASYRTFGVHDWAARLVCCTVAFACVLVTWAWGHRLLGPRAGALGALILCLAPRFVQLERMVTMDGLLCLCVVTAWAAGSVALTGACLRWGWWLASALACGLGLLTKGPVALVLVLPPLLALRWLDAGSVRPRAGAMVVYVIAAVGVAAPWFVALALRAPDFLEYFFWFHHVQRFVEPFDHEEPWWYYLPVLLGGLLPWSLLLPLVLRSALDKVDGPALRQRLGLFAGAGLWCLLFFSLAGCKRAFYILPALPPLALLLGGWLDGWLTQHGPAALLRARCRPACGLTLATWLLALGISVAALASPLVDSATGGLLVLGSGLGLTVALGRSWRQAWQLTWAGGGLAVALVVLVGVSELLPAYARRFSQRGLVRRHADAVAATDVPVLCYPRRWDSVSFYLQKNDVAVYSEDQLPLLLARLRREPAAWVFVKSGRASAQLLEHLPASVRFEPRGRQGALVVGQVVRKE